MKLFTPLSLASHAVVLATLLLSSSIGHAADSGSKTNRGTRQLTFEKCLTPAGTFVGTVDGGCGAGVISYRDIGVSVGTETVHFGGEYTVTTPNCGTFKAMCRGILNTHTGLIVLNGVVIDGDNLGAQVQVRAQLVIGANSVCSQGTMTITPTQ